MLLNNQDKPQLDMEKLDVWAAGIILFEMCVGKDPYNKIKEQSKGNFLFFSKWIF